MVNNQDRNASWEISQSASQGMIAYKTWYIKGTKQMMEKNDSVFTLLTTLHTSFNPLNTNYAYMRN